MPTIKRKTLLAAAIAAALMLTCFWLPLGCALFGAEEPEQCSDEALAELEGKFAAELLATCHEAPSIAECPGAEEVIEKYDALRKDWTQCR